MPEPERTRTVWTWKSAREPGARLPGGWICGSGINGDITTHCAAQPLLALSYRVAGLRLDGSAAPGTQALSVSVGHMQPSASAAKITTAHVQVSFDHGRTWVRRRGDADRPRPVRRLLHRPA